MRWEGQLPPEWGQDENKDLNSLANSHIYALVQERNEGKFMIIEVRWCSSTYNRGNTKLFETFGGSQK